MADTKPRLIRWPEGRVPPRVEEIEGVLRDEGIAAYRMVDPPCTSYPNQIAESAETRWVFEGRLVIWLEDSVVELAAGDRLDLPPGVRRSVQVVSENGAKYLLASVRG